MRMQAEHTGVQVRTVKSFISKIPSVFTGMTQSHSLDIIKFTRPTAAAAAALV